MNLLKLVKSRSSKAIKVIDVCVSQAGDPELVSFLKGLDSEDLRAMEVLKFDGDLAEKPLIRTSHAKASSQNFHSLLFRMVTQLSRLKEFQLIISANEDVERFIDISSEENDYKGTHSLRKVGLHIPPIKLETSHENFCLKVFKHATAVRLSAPGFKIGYQYHQTLWPADDLGRKLLKQNMSFLKSIDFRQIALPDLPGKKSFTQELYFPKLVALRLICTKRLQASITFNCPLLEALSTSLNGDAFMDAFLVRLSNSSMVKTLHFEINNHASPDSIRSNLALHPKLKTILFNSGQWGAPFPDGVFSKRTGGNEKEPAFVCPELERLFSAHELNQNELLKVILDRKNAPNPVCGSLLAVGSSSSTIPFQELGVEVMGWEEMSKDISSHFD